MNEQSDTDLISPFNIDDNDSDIFVKFFEPESYIDAVHD